MCMIIVIFSVYFLGIGDKHGLWVVIVIWQRFPMKWYNFSGLSYKSSNLQSSWSAYTVWNYCPYPEHKCTKLHLWSVWPKREWRANRGSFHMWDVHEWCWWWWPWLGWCVFWCLAWVLCCYAGASVCWCSNQYGCLAPWHAAYPTQVRNIFWYHCLVLRLKKWSLSFALFPPPLAPPFQMYCFSVKHYYLIFYISLQGTFRTNSKCTNSTSLTFFSLLAGSLNCMMKRQNVCGSSGLRRPPKYLRRSLASAAVLEAVPSLETTGMVCCSSSLVNKTFIMAWI